MVPNDDESRLREGGVPPEQENQVPRRGIRRSRKLSGLQARALGDLAFVLYEIAAAQLPGDSKWQLLRAKLLAWRGMYL